MTRLSTDDRSSHFLDFSPSAFRYFFTYFFRSKVHTILATHFCNILCRFCVSKHFSHPVFFSHHILRFQVGQDSAQSKSGSKQTVQTRLLVKSNGRFPAFFVMLAESHFNCIFPSRLISRPFYETSFHRRSQKIVIHRFVP